MKNKEEFNSDINPKNYYGHVLKLKDLEKLKSYREQRNERGFDDTEIWDLDCSIIAFILPRLKRILEIEKNAGVIGSEYFSDLEKQIEIMENYDINQKCDLSLLVKYFECLWW